MRFARTKQVIHPMRTSPLLALFVVIFGFSPAMAAEPFFVDLSPVANTSLQNDGTEGWANEGVNDMFTYPPLPTGEVTRNGYRFRRSLIGHYIPRTAMEVTGFDQPVLSMDGAELWLKPAAFGGPCGQWVDRDGSKVLEVSGVNATPTWTHE